MAALELMHSDRSPHAPVRDIFVAQRFVSNVLEFMKIFKHGLLTVLHTTKMDVMEVWTLITFNVKDLTNRLNVLLTIQCLEVSEVDLSVLRVALGSA